MSSTRNYGIDLLRLVLMYMVCVLHILGQGGVLRSCNVGSVESKIYWLIEIFSFCAVDGYAFMSGYMARDQLPAKTKIVDMWFQVWFYSFVLSIVLTIAGIERDWGLKDLVFFILPVSSGEFWYFTAYFTLFFAFPILNKYLFALDENGARKMLMVLFALFSAMGTLHDAFVTEYGYSPMWIIVLYCMGVLAKRIDLFANRSTAMLVLVFCVCNLITWGTNVFLDTKRLFEYISPTVLVSGICLVIIFSRIKIKGTIVKKLSPLAFGVYLFQISYVVWNSIIKDAFSFVAAKPLFVGVLYVFACAALIFVAGLVIEFLRSKLAELFKIHTLSQKIVDVLDKIIPKFFVFLK